MIIIGIDPGTARMGYGIIENKNNKFSIKDYGCVETESRLTKSERLKILSDTLIKILKKTKPDALALEDVFFFKNVKTAVRVSEARGAVLLTAENAGIPIYEYTPLQIKQAVAGYGRAEKKQIQKMVQLILSLKEMPKPDDAADALASAICCANSIKFKQLTR